MIKLETRKPPARRDYRPKPLDAGQEIIWTREIHGHWTGATWGAGTWVPSEYVIRTGVIWSAGPHPRSLWVTPDDAPGYPVLVNLPAPKRAEAGDQPSESYGAEWAREATRRGESLRRHGSVYSVVESTEKVWGRGYGADSERKRLSWHADPQCPHAAGKVREPVTDWAAYSFRRVLSIVTGAEHDGNSPSPLCRTCIYLEQPARAEQALAS